MNPPLHPMAASGRRTRRGFALVVVLVILSLLAVITVGYLSSMASERATASAFSNKTRAEQAAQAGVDEAIGILRDYFKSFPDSATAWDVSQSTNQDGSLNEGATLYLRAVPQSNNTDTPDPAPNLTDANSSNADFTGGNGPNNVDATAGTDNRTMFALPLVSGATVKQVTNKAATLPKLTPDTTTALGNSINLNGRRQIGDTQGWIGTPTVPAGYNGSSNLPKPAVARWVEVNQKDGVSTGTTAPVTSRYAFWIEDESFRVNVSTAGLGQNSSSGSAHQRRDNPSNYSVSPLDLDLLAPLTVALGSDPTTDAQTISTTRSFYPNNIFPEARAFAHAAGLHPPAYPDINGDSTLTAEQKASKSLARFDQQLTYLTTTQSSALNLSRHGTQRLNLNQVVPQPSPAASPAPVLAASVVKGQIDQIVKTIQYHAPNFSQRFYRSKADSSAQTLNSMDVPDDANQYRLAYLYKVAANIRDYIDQDPTPTIINSNKYVHDDGTTDPGGTIRTGKQLHSFWGPGGSNGANEIWAQGKDSAPFIDESGMRCRGGHLTTDPSKYLVAIDYYIEVWNMSNQDVVAKDLGPNPVIRVANPTQWISTSPADPHLYNIDPAPATASPYDSRVKPPLRDFDIDLSGVTFKAGVATVITTDPDFKQIITDVNAQNNVNVCGFYPKFPDPNAVGKRIFNGTLPKLSDGKTYAAGLKMVWGDPTGNNTTGATGSSDYETELIFETDNGVIDCMEGGMPIYDGGTANVFLTAAQAPMPSTWQAALPFMGGSLHGNNGGTSYPGVMGDPRSNNEQLFYTVYAGSTVDSSRYFNEIYASGQFTLGLPNVNYMHPEGGGSYTPWADYYIFPSATSPVMTDKNAPSVVANTKLTSIGQLGDVYDPARLAGVSLTGARGGGRTFKIGQHDDRWDGNPTSASRTWASWRLTDFFDVSDPKVSDPMDQPGLVNINGAPRDNGAALRAALTGFTFQPTTTPTGSQAAQPGSKTLAVDANTSSSGLQQLIDQIKARLATPPPATYSNGYASTDNTGSGPFFERGELSELPGFSRNAAPGALVSGVDMASSFDREREELFRRLIEMITVRGNVFTVYAMGQSINQNTASNVKRVTGTHQIRVTFKLMPKDSQGNDFHPAYDNSGSPIALDLTNPQKRFAKPDHYDVQILSASSGNG